MSKFDDERKVSTSSDENIVTGLNKSPQKSYGNFDDITNKDDLKKHGHSENTTNKFPKSVFLIIITEFCERFSYYGLKTVLIIYLTHFLMLSETHSTAIYHAFSMLCYFTPILGAIIADAYIGQYRTIVYLSIIYCLGDFILCLTSMKPLGAPELAGPLIGLLLISIGTGGIKPCVAAFGANQFNSDQKKSIDTYFSLFYFSINLGSFLGTILTPILRSDIKCFNTDCFPVAFAVPAILMFLSIIIFLCGRSLYKREMIKSENLFKNVFTCIFHAINMKIKNRKNSFNQKANWLDYSTDRFDEKFVGDVKSMLRVICIFIPVPVFWALFDQQGSRWTIQAQKLNIYLTSDNSFVLKPDQIQAINPILILLLIPFFNWVVYPIFGKCNLLKRPLQRMTIGMFFGALAFVASALLEMNIDLSYKAVNVNNKIEFINISPCNINVQTLNLTHQLNSFERFESNFNDVNQSLQIGCLNDIQTLQLTLTQNTEDFKNYYVFYKNSLNVTDVLHIQSKLNDQPVGMSNVRFYSLINQNYSVNLNAKSINLDFNMVNLQQNSSIEPNADYHKVGFDMYKLTVNSKNVNESFSGAYNILNGARYTFILYANPDTNTNNLLQLNDLKEYQINIFYQVIPYFILTIGEIMFAINGLSFAYSQAPATMKSILQSFWLLTVAFGNLIVVFISEMHFVSSQFYEYLLFAGLMAITTIVFGIISYFYVYVDGDGEKKSDDSKEDLTSSNVQLIRMNSIDIS